MSTLDFPKRDPAIIAKENKAFDIRCKVELIARELGVCKQGPNTYGRLRHDIYTYKDADFFIEYAIVGKMHPVWDGPSTYDETTNLFVRLQNKTIHFFEPPKSLEDKIEPLYHQAREKNPQ